MFVDKIRIEQLDGAPEQLDGGLFREGSEQLILEGAAVPPPEHSAALRQESRFFSHIGLDVIVAEDRDSIAESLERRRTSIDLGTFASTQAMPAAVSDSSPRVARCRSMPRMRPTSLAPSHTITDGARKASG